MTTVTFDLLFRGKVDCRTYRADLELQGAIVPDRCCWEVKSSEPVLRLVKQQQGNWEKLVRNKVCVKRVIK